MRITLMEKQHISLGAVPAYEPCAQVGQDGYEDMARAECRRYAALLRDTYIEFHGAIPQGLRVRVKSYPHDFGVYFDVVAEYHPDDDDAVEAAVWLENNSPMQWPA